MVQIHRICCIWPYCFAEKDNQIFSHSRLRYSYLHGSMWAGFLVPKTYILNLNKAFGAIQHRAAHILVHYIGTPVSVERARTEKAGIRIIIL